MLFEGTINQFGLRIGSESAKPPSEKYAKPRLDRTISKTFKCIEDCSGDRVVKDSQLQYADTMIQLKTMLNCIDNSGAAVVECVNVLKKKSPATVGDRIVVVVQKQRNFGPENSTNSGIANKVRRGDIRHAVVVRARKEIQRPDGSLIKFDDNACVLVNKSGDPIGTRLNGIVGAELRGKQWSKILSLAPMHV